jgi:hypothetical protein
MNAAGHAAGGEIHAPAGARRGTQQGAEYGGVEAGAGERLCHQAAFPGGVGGVFEMLEGASAASGEMPAGRRYPLRACKQNFVKGAALRAGFRCADKLTRQRARDMHRPLGHPIAVTAQPQDLEFSGHRP